MDFEPLVARRVYLDENLDPLGPVARFLRARDIDVLAVSAHGGLARRRDEFHYLSARVMGRLLVTRDRDFLGHRFALAQSPGVLVLHAPSEAFAAALLERFWSAWTVAPLAEDHARTKTLVADGGFTFEYLDERAARCTVAGCFLPLTAVAA